MSLSGGREENNDDLRNILLTVGDYRAQCACRDLSVFVLGGNSVIGKTTLGT